MKMKRKKNISPFFSEIVRPYRGRVIGLCCLTVCASILQVVMAILSRYVIDAALYAGEKLAFWSVLLIADVVAILLVSTLLSWYNSSTMEKVAAYIRQRILRTAVYTRDERILDRHSGELMNRSMEDVRILCDGIVNALPTLVGQVTRLITAFAAVVVLSPVVAGVLLIAAIVIGVAAACMRPVLRKHNRRVRESDERLMATMQEDLQQIELVQSLDAQEQTLIRYAKKLKRNLQIRFRRRLWSVGAHSIVGTASSLGSGALLLWGAAQISVGALSYGTLTAMLSLLSQFRSPVLGLSGVWTRLASVEVAVERLEALLAPAKPAQKQQVSQPVESIVFENVTFAYPGEEMPVLQNFYFRFPLNGWTCLTGVSGKGKTTIFKLILGLYKPQEGHIYLQTKDEQIPCSEATRHLFAYVPQDYALFSGTVLENFQLIQPDISEECLKEILSIAQADYVWSMTDKEYTQVRENNAGLSKGQLQRLAIARAVLMDRQIFLLDECTSALDAQTEDAVLHALKQLGKQAILVTHRPEAVEALEDVDMVSMER